MEGKLIFTTGSRSGVEIELGDSRVRIGRADDMDVVIPTGDARFVSRHHATITPSGQGFVLEDQGSTNGLFVNGIRVRRHVLRHGDIVRFGKNLEARAILDLDATRVAEGSDATEWMGAPGPAPPAPAAGGARPHSAASGSAPGRAGSAAPAAVQAAPRRRGALLAIGGLTAVLAAGGAVAWQSGMLEPSPEARFPAIAEEYQQSVFLVETGLSLGGEYYRLGQGTAFAAAEGGYLITNKHVVRPHLYDPVPGGCLAHIAEASGDSFEDLLVVTVWRGGSPFRQPGQDAGDRGLGYSSTRGSLQVLETGSDNLAPARAYRCPQIGDLRPFEIPWRPHRSDNADLAVLRIDDDPVPFPIASEEPPRDERVMVFGFPRGQDVIESNTADPVWQDGRVIRVQETIQIDAVVHQGNSGGPLLNSRGEVVGVTTRGINNIYNNAIKISFAEILLRQAR